MDQVQALRGAARRAGVPEHIVTGVRLRKTPPSDGAQGCRSGGSSSQAGSAQSDGHGTLTDNRGSPMTSTSDSKDDGKAATDSTAQMSDRASQPSAAANASSEIAALAGTIVYQASKAECSRQLRYSLVAVVVHHGGPDSGHYATFRCVGDRREWFLVSDADVWPVAERTVLNSEATLVMYEQDHRLHECA